jgi:hypothetical protein
MRTFARALTVTVAAGLLSASAVGAATPAQRLGADRRAATAAADALLNGVVLPADARPQASEPSGDAHQLARPFELFFYAAEVDRHAFWSTGAAPAAVIASVGAHLPPGARSTASGFSSGNGSSSVFASYALPIVHPSVLGPRALVIDAVTLPGGITGVRADAVVRYLAPRLPAQRIPRAARLLEIRTVFASRVLRSLTVTRISQVRRIAAVIDGLPFAGGLKGIAIPCPFIPAAPIVTFTFRAAATLPALAVVTEPADTPAGASPCTLTTLRIRGHREPPLLEGGVLLHRAGAILGVTLTSTITPTASVTPDRATSRDRPADMGAGRATRTALASVARS